MKARERGTAAQERQATTQGRYNTGDMDDHHTITITYSTNGFVLHTRHSATKGHQQQRIGRINSKRIIETRKGRAGQGNAAQYFIIFVLHTRHCDMAGSAERINWKRLIESRKGWTATEIIIASPRRGARETLHKSLGSRHQRQIQVD